MEFLAVRVCEGVADEDGGRANHRPVHVERLPVPADHLEGTVFSRRRWGERGRRRDGGRRSTRPFRHACLVALLGVSRPASVALRVRASTPRAVGHLCCCRCSQSAADPRAPMRRPGVSSPGGTTGRLESHLMRGHSLNTLGTHLVRTHTNNKTPRHANGVTRLTRPLTTLPPPAAFSRAAPSTHASLLAVNNHSRWCVGRPGGSSG